ESQVIRQLGVTAGLENTVIVNTCAVTAEAERQARQAIRRARRDNPNANLIVTGCAAQVDPDSFADMPEVDQVLGNREKLEVKSYLGGDSRDQVEVANIMTVRKTAPHLINSFGGRARAFVQVQQGCDHRCTFCIIPFARGNNRSVELSRLDLQIRKLVEAGCREVVLTGVDICSYGTDLPGRPRLGELAAQLLKALPELARLRLSSLDPAAIDDELFELLAMEQRLMPHLHLSLQAMDDTVLKRMKRRHLAADAERVVARARQARPDVVFGADIIAGFPTETETMFANTLAAVDGLGLTHLHVFPYSERPGTPAARMPAVPQSERKRRAAALREAGNVALNRFLETQVGSKIEVLVERSRRGLSRHYAVCELDVDGEPGAVVTARATAVANGVLKGSAIV
ncbi:MAG: tRNA (N(6)-L-threonylcarbamoyladenosine(37)-C(2))-methylthiotransferase MtaB, partial [Rhodospirillales bacterium]